MHATEAVADAKRFMEICNACRYCESYCAVFPAMEQQRSFTDTDMAYLANLCHNCQGCYHACQFSPPHEFGINLPKTFAEVRQQSYAEYAWPAGAGKLFEKNGTLVSLLSAAAIALVIILTMAFHDLESLTRARSGPGSFYAVIPWGVMVAIAGITFGYAVIALLPARSGSGWRHARR
jgi:citrate/tricarballylate utilization protein